MATVRDTRRVVKELQELNAEYYRSQLEVFVRESNRIEGIRRTPHPEEIQALEQFMMLSAVDVEAMEILVEVFEPGARLRSTPGMNVRIGSYYPPEGGPGVQSQLTAILDMATEFRHTGIGRREAYSVHKKYESLHPFMDGNGRSGRALWLWMRGGDPGLGFLHEWYYSSLKD